MSLFADPSTVLVSPCRDGRIVAERPRLRDRLAAHWRTHRLDRDLANGVSPETSAALALRAHDLTEPDRRWSIAGALRRVMREAEEDRRPPLSRVPPNLRAVKSAREELTALADALAEPGPVAAQGVAQAWLLVTDGTGPLYNARSRATLCARAAGAAQDLRPWAA